MPGNLNTPVLAPLYADGMPLAALGQALSGTGSASAPARFWSTPPRAAADTTREVLQVSLGAARTLNRVSVSLPRFPHTSWLQAYDDTTATWMTLVDAGGNAAQVSFTDSLPPVVSVGVTDTGRRHPAHYGAGHWVPTTFEFTPVTTTQLRLVQVRVPSGAIPVGVTGSPQPYPLGARDLVVGYATDTPGGAPLRTGAIATTADILGSTITHTLLRADAWGLPIGRTWRSAPMPTADSVVGLYVDCRDALGAPQLVDRLYLDPITSGVSMCVYYTSDAPIADTFPASDAPMGAYVVPSVSAPVISNGLLTFSGTSCYLDIAASAVAFDPGSPFALGLSFAPVYASTAAGPYTLLDAEGFTVSFAAGVLTASIGTAQASLALSFASGTPLVVGVFSDGATLSLSVGGVGQTASTAGVRAVGRSASIRLGGAQGATPATSDMSVSALALWQCGAAQAHAGLAAFLTSPDSVMLLPSTEVVSHPSDGTVLRVDPRRADADTAFGVFGAPGIDLSRVRWIPLARDAVARSGALAMAPMLATLLKIEFTNLAPAPLETTGGVLTSAPLLDSTRQSQPSVSSTGSPDPGTGVISANGASNYSDMRRLPAATTYPVSPTEALYAPDPQVASRINDGPGFGFTRWQTPASPVTPRHAGVHTDAPVQTSITQRQTFFVALRKIALGRFQNGAAPLDYARLVETTDDALGLGPTGGAGLWERANGRLVTPSPAGGRRIVTSLPYVSHHPVVAVQFASTCSDAAGVITDADFTAPDFSAWSMIGDATVAVGTGYASAVGHAAALTRHGGASGGIASVQTLTPGRTGRLYGAVRLYAPTDASAPWQLSLVNGDGTILAQASATPTAGQVLEFTCQLNLDVPLVSGVDTWGTYDNTGTWASMAAHGSYAVVSGAGLWIHDVSVHLAQTGVDSDTVLIDSLAMFYDPITWEVSADGGTDWFPVADIRNDPAGVLVLPPATTGTSLMWRASCDAPGVSISAVALRPWYELRAGGVRPQPPGIPSGPLLSPADHFGPIEEDPMWMAWDRGVPRSWWASGRSF